MYDPQLGRWFVMDPAIEDNHFDYSPYAYVYNNPMLFIDPFGLDSIFYDQAGEEINRISCDNDFFFLEHSDGNKTINGNNYYQGLSKESFFGDRSGDGELFENVDKTTMDSDEKIAEDVDSHTKQDETVLGFLKESPQGKHYDYKNTLLGPQAEIPIDNIKTAYMYRGILLNRNEAGNVYWGATTEKLRIPYSTVIIGVHGYSLLDEGKLDERGEQIAILIGRSLYAKDRK